MVFLRKYFFYIQLYQILELVVSIICVEWSFSIITTCEMSEKFEDKVSDIPEKLHDKNYDKLYNRLRFFGKVSAI